MAALERPPKRRVPAQAGWRRQDRTAPSVDEALELVRPHRIGRPQAGDALGRSAAAGSRSLGALVARPGCSSSTKPSRLSTSRSRDRLRLELRRLTRELGLTVIHVTHDRQEALALADRVAVLRDGRIAEVGPPAQILRAPRSPFVAEFLSDATLVSGSIDAGVFTADDHPLTVDCDPVSDDGRVLVAIVPDAVRLSSLDDTAGIAAADPRTEHGVRSRTQEDHRATVRSSLFTATGSDLVIDWHGLEMRVRTASGTIATRTRPSSDTGSQSTVSGWSRGEHSGVDAAGHEGGVGEELRDERRPRRPEDLGRRPDLRDASIAEHSDPVGQGECLLPVMGDVDDGETEFAGEPTQFEPQAVTERLVESREGFVERSTRGRATSARASAIRCR
ncbi:Spermidine/putrescine import ATP-binding protein PotA [Brevibacterium casei]|uniref:Spermidine/putrescine import ATP-binding protein PotA n=1 Tax=Brevibacterium casei TaxID=33889 RepID=A0A449CY39_9MICO|nr:hypothetical protein [Brevibacterium casei]VEW10173.1 Spermidine/putrescine import ATP-binding protein PotA [Brevibacterium casei]